MGADALAGGLISFATYTLRLDLEAHAAFLIEQVMRLLQDDRLAQPCTTAPA